MLTTAGCGEDHDLGTGGNVLSTTSDSDSTTGASSSETGVLDGSDSSGGGGSGSGGGGGGGLPCSMQGMFGSYAAELPVLGEPIEVTEGIDPAIVCDDAALVDPSGLDETRLSTDEPVEGEGSEDTFSIYVYRPEDGQGNWPSAPPHPAIFFAPGRGLDLLNDSDLSNPDNHFSWPIFEPLAESGFVVFAIEPSNTDWGGGKRRAALACAMMWAQDTTNGWAAAGEGRISDSIVLMGQSRGASAASRLTKSLLCAQSANPAADGCCFAASCSDVAKDDLPIASALDDYEVCSTVSIAPRWNAADATVILDTDAPPFLMVQGSIDDDTLGQGIKAYDADVAEGQGERSSDKVALWLYGATHRAFGGGTAFGGDRLGKTQADAVAPYYIEQFLRWQLFADQDAREQILVLTSPDATQSDYPASIWDPTLWTVDGTVAGDPDIAVFYEGDGATLDGIGRPLVFADYQQGTIEVGAERLVIDDLERSTTVADCDGSFGASTLGGDVTVSAIGPGTGGVSVCQGPAEELQPDAGAGAKHESSALRLGWGLDTPGIEVAWDLRDADGLALRTAADYTHLSIRVGNLIESCPPTTDEVELEIELEFESADGSLVNRTVTTGILPDQHGQEVILAGTAGGSTGCVTSQFMRTVRIPLIDFCDQGMTTVDAMTTLRVSALPSTTDHIVQIDSVELTRDPDAALPVSCPQSRSDWACVVTGVLAPQETACAGEPIAGACDPQDTTVTAVATPVVDPGPGSFDGWVVHTPKGWVGDGDNPTSAELSDILGLCVGACEREWDGVSPISANCDDPGAFVTPTRRAAPGPSTVHRIKEFERDGSGIVPGLGCDLLSDCCTQFDEDLCAAAPLRMTSARQPLGRGEEYRIALGGPQTKARFLTPGGAVNMPLVGEAGYSLFEGPTGPGAFYLGSLSASGTSAVTVTDTCPDGSPFSHQVTDLDLELVQPAFAAGKAPPSKAKIFPAGALHIIGTITVDGTTYTVRSLTEKRVYVRVDGGDVFTGWMDINFSAPCGDSVLPVTLRVILADQTLLDQKPAVALTTPATIQCPTSITLTATASDPDGDLDSVRYYIDDVLLDASVSSVSIAADHTIKVTARDMRGATATDTKAIVCL